MKNKVIKFLKNNFIYISMFFLGGFIVYLPLPYYVDAPGGLINIEDKVIIDEKYDSDGSFNMCYVSNYRATIPLLFISMFRSDWDVLKMNEVLEENDTLDTLEFRNRIFLTEANQSAIIVAYKKANRDISITNSKVYITYVYSEAKTSLKVGDIVNEVNGAKVSGLADITEALKNSKAGDYINIKVTNNDNEYIRTATLIEVDGKPFIGVYPAVISDISVDPDIKFNFSDSESGPSGGFMMALAIYNDLIEEDLTRGYVIGGTGTIDIDGNVGPISGVKYKLIGAVNDGADIFFAPNDTNYEEAIKVKKDRNLDIEIVGIDTIDDAIKYLENKKAD